MHPKVVKVVFRAGCLLIFFLAAQSLLAQDRGAMLSGKVTDSSGASVANAKVAVRNMNTGVSSETTTDASGVYKVPALAPGDYEVSVDAHGFEKKVVETTLTVAASQAVDVVLVSSVPASASPQSPSGGATTQPFENLPNAPSASKSEPSLQDLGFSPAESQGNAAQQALLDKRTHMLKVHQKLGLITTVPMIATVITSFNAGGKQTSKTSRDVHAALGGLTGGLYFTTAYFAIRAPRVPGSETRGPIRVHKILAWIHGPGMVLTPILGTMAFQQKSNGEHVHGIAAAHGPVAIVTAGAFGAALLSVSTKF